MKPNIILKIFIIQVVSCLGAVSSYSQQIITESKTINYQDGQEIFKVCKVNPSVVINDALDYFWYNEYSGIKNTKGGIGGQLLHGKYQLFGKSGNLLKESNYYLGLEHGLTRTWDEEGAIKETLRSNNGICIYMKFKNEEGYIVEWTGEMFKKGSVKKIFTSYNQLVEESTCIEPFKFYTKIYYEEYGDPKLQAEFTRGIGDYYYGSYKAFYRNGNKKASGNFIENQKEGIWSYYNEDGSIQSQYKFRIYEEKYPSGNMRIQGSQIFNEETNEWLRDGRWLYYEENGQDYKKIEEYKAGQLIETN